MTTLLDTFLPRVRGLLFPYSACTPAIKCPEELPDRVRIALLEAEVAQLRLERDSFAELATTALVALQQRLKEPVKLWVKAKPDMSIVDELVRRDHVEGMAAVGHPWRRLEIWPVFPEWAPTGPVQPVRASIPPEIFGHIGLFVNRKTSLVLCQVDFAWFTHFFPLNKRLPGPTFSLSNRACFVSLLSRGRDRTPSPSVSRLDPSLSLRHLTTLSLSATLMSDGNFTALSLDNLGLGGSPIHLETLSISIYLANFSTGAHFSPSVILLSLLDPTEVHLFLTFPDCGGRNTIRLSRSGADVMCAWSRLRRVYHIDLDLRITRTDQDALDPTAHEYFLYMPAGPDHQGTSIWWDMQSPAANANPPRANSVRSPRLLQEPIQYFASRKPLVSSRIKRAYLIIKDDEERTKERARSDVPSQIAIRSEYDPTAEPACLHQLRLSKVR